MKRNEITPLMIQALLPVGLTDYTKLHLSHLSLLTGALSVLRNMMGGASFAEGGEQSQAYVSPHGLKVDIDATKPHKAYSKRKRHFDAVKKLDIPSLWKQISPNKVRIVCISDTHCKTKNLVLPPGDILVHSGDFTARGRIEETQVFADFMKQQPHKHKVVIAGNHELGFGACDGYIERDTLRRLWGKTVTASFFQRMKELGLSHPKELLKDVTYLDNSSATVCGLKFWGSPWTPYFHGWAYNAYRGEESLRIWDTIPTDTDVVMTHGPPLGIGDYTMMGDRAGCVELFTTITKRVKPKLHVYGHIHEGYGLWTDDTTLFANASTCTIRYKPLQEPICIDIDLPEGFTKDDISVDDNSKAVKIISRVYDCQQDEESQTQTRESMAGVFSQIKLRQTD